ncbi:flavin reductase family protein [Agromyces aureus]|uniref:flavin reductase family protein n=1 Tax=Agromyces aureus TaxID=453304 RepID=UPI000942DE92|nr:flavin reductase family protein [Agromyces aureus]
MSTCTDLGTSEVAQHSVIDPAILYFGTPVALLATVDEAGHPNLAPNSSIWWLGQTAVVGIAARSQTARNLLAVRECVINLPSVMEVDAVDRLALTTGRTSVSERKSRAGYRHVHDKFAAAGLSAAAADRVAPPRVAECPVNLEGRVRTLHPLRGAADPTAADLLAVELDIVRVHIHEHLRLAGHENRIDPDRWRPLMMSFQRYFGLGTEAHPSLLSTIDEDWYRG